MESESLSIMVIHTHEPEKVKAFFEEIGFHFMSGNGLGMRSCTAVVNGKVLEICRTDFAAQRIQFRSS